MSAIAIRDIGDAFQDTGRVPKLLIPLPFVTALVLLLVGLRLVRFAALPAAARVIFAALSAVAVTESVLVGMRFGYGVEGLIRLQRVLPLLVGPLLYLGFAAMRSPVVPARAASHLGVALAAAGAAALAPASADVVIGASYMAYIVLLWRLYRQGADALALLPVEVTSGMRRWLAGAVAILAFSLVVDSAIAALFVLGAEERVSGFIALGSVPVIAALLFALMRLPVQSPRAARAPSPAADAALFEEIAGLLGETRLYRDPELSLSRLARRIGRPAREVSRAVNAATGASVSHYVNGWRIEDAAEMLGATDEKVDEIARRCGFMSRSNFYREFQRLYGQSPASYRRNRAASARDHGTRDG